MIKDFIEKNPGVTGPNERVMKVSDEPTFIYFVGLVKDGFFETCDNTGGGSSLWINSNGDIVDQSKSEFSADTSGRSIQEWMDYYEDHEDDVNAEEYNGLFVPEFIEEDWSGHIIGFSTLEEARYHKEQLKQTLTYSDYSKLEIRKMVIPSEIPWFRIEESWEGKTDDIATYKIIQPTDSQYIS